jgi:hypothetical protein
MVANLTMTPYMIYLPEKVLFKVKFIDKLLKNSDLYKSSVKSIADLAETMNSFVSTIRALVNEINEQTKQIAELQMMINQLATDVYGGGISRAKSQDKLMSLNDGQANTKKKNTVN